jgi:hypothetical protein
MNATTTNNKQSYIKMNEDEMKQQRDTILISNGTLLNNHNHNTASTSSIESIVQHNNTQYRNATSFIDDGNSTDALADAFSSSLANIAAAGRITNSRNIRNNTNHHRSTVTNSDESQNAITDFNHPIHHASIKKKNPLVTAATTASSDDRYSSEMDGFKNNMIDCTNHHHQHHHRRRAYLHADKINYDDDDDNSNDDDRPHYHRNHKQRLQQQEHVDTTATTTPLTPEAKLLSSDHHEGSLLSPSSVNSSTAVDRFLTNEKSGLKRKCMIEADINDTKASLSQKRLSLLINDDAISISNTSNADMEDTSGGINSGSEGGYSASYSSNGDSCAADYYDSCNSSLNNYDDDDYDYYDDSDDENHRLIDATTLGKHRRQQQGQHQSGDPTRPMLSTKKIKTHDDRQDSSSLSSDIADFSSNFMSDDSSKKTTQSPSPSLSSSSSSTNLQLESGIADEVVRCNNASKSRRRRRTTPVWTLMSQHSPTSMIVGIDSHIRVTKRTPTCDHDKKPAAIDRSNVTKPLDGKIPIMTLDCDVLANVLTFLAPPEVLDVLTMPLSKGWLSQYTSQPELWRVLCHLEPFKAQVDDEGDDSSGISNSSSTDDDSIFLDSLSTKRSAKFRLLYASYVRCMRCLARIKKDALSGRQPSVIDYAAVLEESGSLAATTSIKKFGSNQNLQQFLSRARYCSTRTTTSYQVGEMVVPVDNSDVAVPVIDCCDPKSQNTKSVACPVGKSQSSQKKPKIKFTHSKLTQRLVGPSVTGLLGEIELPWSYGIYSIVNWMVAYFDVEGIQIMCLRVLPLLLENEQQRIIAQRTGLTDIVLRVMVLFPKSISLHTSAFHTIVLLARPLGGQEGMLFHTSMVNSSGIFGSSTESSVGGKSGIAVLIDSMRRFASNEALQSMACWSLVNIALAPAQKEVLVNLGGIDVIAQAMVNHQLSAEVQFRALFALINLVIPSVANNNDNSTVDLVNQDLCIDGTEREMLDEMVDQIIGLVVVSMKNFCTNEAILNRACLVLHNLSLSTCYHTAMLWSPNCYQILEWCLGNYRTDQVLQQSAAGTLHRLQTTLSRDETLRIRFTAKLQERQKESIDRAKQDSIRFKEIERRQTVEIARLAQQRS